MAIKDKNALRLQVTNNVQAQMHEFLIFQLNFVNINKVEYKYITLNNLYCIF